MSNLGLGNVYAPAPESELVPRPRPEPVEEKKKKKKKKVPLPRENFMKDEFSFLYMKELEDIAQLKGFRLKMINKDMLYFLRRFRYMDAKVNGLSNFFDSVFFKTIERSRPRIALLYQVERSDRKDEYDANGDLKYEANPKRMELKNRQDEDELKSMLSHSSPFQHRIHGIAFWLPLYHENAEYRKGKPHRTISCIELTVVHFPSLESVEEDQQQECALLFLYALSRISSLRKVRSIVWTNFNSQPSIHLNPNGCLLAAQFLTQNDDRKGFIGKIHDRKADEHNDRKCMACTRTIEDDYYNAYIQRDSINEYKAKMESGSSSSASTSSARSRSANVQGSPHSNFITDIANQPRYGWIANQFGFEPNGYACRPDFRKLSQIDNVDLNNVPLTVPLGDAKSLLCTRYGLSLQPLLLEQRNRKTQESKNLQEITEGIRLGADLFPKRVMALPRFLSEEEEEEVEDIEEKKSPIEGKEAKQPRQPRVPRLPVEEKKEGKEIRRKLNPRSDMTREILEQWSMKGYELFSFDKREIMLLLNQPSFQEFFNEVKQTLNQSPLDEKGLPKYDIHWANHSDITRMINNSPSARLYIFAKPLASSSVRKPDLTNWGVFILWKTEDKHAFGEHYLQNKPRNMKYRQENIPCFQLELFAAKPRNAFKGLGRVLLIHSLEDYSQRSGVDVTNDPCLVLTELGPISSPEKDAKTGQDRWVLEFDNPRLNIGRALGSVMITYYDIGFDPIFSKKYITLDDKPGLENNIDQAYPDIRTHQWTRFFQMDQVKSREPYLMILHPPSYVLQSIVYLTDYQNRLDNNDAFHSLPDL